MRIRGGFREVFKVSSHSTGHRSRPRPDNRHLKHEANHACERSLDAEQTSHCSELVHQPIYEQMQALLSSLEEEHGRFSLEQRMRDNFPRFEEISDFTTTLVEAHLGRNDVPLPGHLEVGRERSPDSRRQRRTEASVLRLSFHEWATNQILKAEKVGARSLRHLEEAQALLSNLLDHCPHGVSSEKRHKESKNNWADIEMGIAESELRPYGLRYEPRTIKG